jgi:hypothetical protein
MDAPPLDAPPAVLDVPPAPDAPPAPDELLCAKAPTEVAASNAPAAMRESSLNAIMYSFMIHVIAAERNVRLWRKHFPLELDPNV